MAVVPLRRNREFRLLWGGQTLSELGSQLSLVAYPLLVLAVTGSPAKAGVVGFAKTVPYAVLALPAGALADRVNRAAS
jgi:MFS family permease